MSQQLVPVPVPVSLNTVGTAIRGLSNVSQGGSNTINTHVSIVGGLAASNVTASGPATLYGITSHSNAAYFSSNVSLIGPVAMSGALNVYGVQTQSNAAFFSSNVSVQGASLLSNSLTVYGATTLSNSLNIYGVQTHSNAAFFSSNVSVQGASLLSNSLTVYGPTTLSNALDVYGVQTQSNAAFFSSNVRVHGPATLNKVTVNSNLTVLGTIEAVSFNYAYSNSIMYTSETMQSNLTVLGTTNMYSNAAGEGLVVFGTSTFKNNVTNATTGTTSAINVFGKGKYAGTDSNNGVVLGLGNNTTGNRQLWVMGSDTAGTSSGANPIVRVIPMASTIDAVGTDGTTQVALNVGNTFGGVNLTGPVWATNVSLTGQYPIVATNTQSLGLTSCVAASASFGQNMSLPYANQGIFQATSTTGATCIALSVMSSNLQTAKITTNGDATVKALVANSASVTGNASVAGNVSVTGTITTGGLTAPAIAGRILDLSGTMTASGQPGPISASKISGTGITASTLSPFSGGNSAGGSLYFPGIAGNYLTAAPSGSAAAPVGALSSFTVECWVYLPSAYPSVIAASSTIPYLIGQMVPTTNTTHWSFGIGGSSMNRVAFYGGAAGNCGAAGSTVIPLGVWTHIALSYDASTRTVKAFVNGAIETLTVSVQTAASGNNTTAITMTSGFSVPAGVNLVVGQVNNVATNAYVADLRYTQQVLYTATFTPSTYPLQVTDTTTMLLLRASNTNVVGIANQVNTLSDLRVHCLPGDAVVYVDCFGTNLPNLSGSTPTFDSAQAKCIRFNRDLGQTLQFPPQTFNIGTQGFTAICKFAFTGTTVRSNESLFQFHNGGANNNNSAINLFRNSTTATITAALISQDQSASVYVPQGQNIFQNIVYVVALRFDPVTLTYSTWINGMLNGSVVASTSATYSDRTLQNITLGAGLTGNIFTFAAYNRALSDKEMVDASAALMVTVNTATVDVGNVNCKPALQVKNDGTVSIAGPLTCTNNTSYAPMDLGASGFAISGLITGSVPATGASPFGASEGSIYFNGTVGNYVTIPITQFAWSTVGFTIEAWVNINSFAETNNVVGSMQATSIGNEWALGVGTSGTPFFYYWTGAANNLFSSSTIPRNTWTHLAASCDGTTYRLFVNGALVASALVSAGVILSGISSILVGQYYNLPCNASVTNVRLVKGAALYTASFTPLSTDALMPASSGTTLILLRVPQNPGKLLVKQIGGTAVVQAYPPTSMTGNTINIQNTGYGAGTYVASASSYLYNSNYGGSGIPFYGFTSSGLQFWESDISDSTVYDTYLYKGSNSTSDAFGNKFAGEWLQLQLPVAVTLTSFYLGNHCGNTAYTPASVALLGSCDGTSWMLVSAQSGITTIDNTFAVSTSAAYSYYRLVAMTNNGAICVCASLILYGTQSSITIAPNGQVGLGVTSPVQALEVAGNAVINGSISATGPLASKNASSYAAVDLGPSGFAIDAATTGLVQAVAYSPFVGSAEGSLRFNGAVGNYITVPNPNFWWWLNGGFTCEAWVNYSVFTDTPLIGNMGATSPRLRDWSFGIISTGAVQFMYYNNINIVYVTTSATLTQNTWTHIAVTCDSTNIRLYINGALSTLTTNATTTTIVGTPTVERLSTLTIGQFENNSCGAMNVASLRLVLGPTLYYRSKFTPSTSPLTVAPIGTTVLLLRVPQSRGMSLGGGSTARSYPPASLTASTTILQNVQYGAGTYVASQSSVFNMTNQAWSAFNTSINNRWASTSAAGYGGAANSDGFNYTGSTLTVDVSGNSYAGEWLQLQLPTAIMLSSYTVAANGGTMDFMTSWVVLGSNDGTNFKFVDSQSARPNATCIYNVKATVEYAYYRVVVRSTTASNGIGSCVIWHGLTFNGFPTAVTIAPDGQVGVGVSNPVQALEVLGNAVVTGNIGVGMNGVAPSYPLHVMSSASTVSIYAAGDITCFSDARVKTDVRVIEGALEKVGRISGYTFARLGLVEDGRSAGVLAQEVREVLPEVVREDAETGTLSVAYPNMIALLIEAIKELRTKVDALS